MSNEHITDERAAFVSWSQREYRHATIYTNRDFEIGLAAWEARAALRPAAQPALAVPAEVSAAVLAERESCAVIAWSYYADTCQRQGLNPMHFGHWCSANAIRTRNDSVVLPLSAAPTAQPVAVPDRVPMTDEDAKKLLNRSDLLDMFLHIGWYSAPRKNFDQNALLLLRAIEAHHGITTPKADK